MASDNDAHLIRKAVLTVRMRPPVVTDVRVDVPDEANAEPKLEARQG